jgi:plastocyanin
MRTRARFLPVVLLVAVVAAACGGDDGGGGASVSTIDPVENLPEVADSEFVDMTGESEVLIEAKDNKFAPQFVTVSPGTKVTFENKGRNPHNVIPVVDDQFPTVPTDEFQSGDTAVVTFDEAGLYPYYCSLHGTPSAGMDGRIRVAEG